MKFRIYTDGTEAALERAKEPHFSTESEWSQSFRDMEHFKEVMTPGYVESLMDRAYAAGLVESDRKHRSGNDS